MTHATLQFCAVVIFGVLAAAADSVTFAKDIAPIFQDKCEVCHRAGR